MSLISEALRKARADAAEREGRRYGVPPALALSPRRPRRGLGVTRIAMLVVAAAGLGAVVGWWAFARKPASERGVAAALAGATPTPLVAALAQTATPTPRGALKMVRAAAPTPAGAPEPVREAVQNATGAPESALAAAAPPVEPPERAPTAAPLQHTLQPIRNVSAAAAPRLPAPVTEAEGPPSPASRPVGERREAAPPGGNVTSGSAAAGGERTFVIDADLGRVKLHLDYVVFRPRSPFASVNGSQIVVGSIIEGFTVEEIGPDFVRLSDRHGAVVLRVR